MSIDKKCYAITGSYPNASDPERKDKLFSVVVRDKQGVLVRAGYCWAPQWSLAHGWAWSTAARRGETPEDITISVEEA